MARYITEADLRLFCHDDVAYDSKLFGMAIEAAEQYLDNETGRYIALDTPAAAARVFRPNRYSRRLHIGDCTSVTSVTENGQALTVNSHYILEPLNGRTIAGEVRPYDTLVRLRSCWYTDDLTATVSVTAKWGWATIPAAAKFACLVAAKAYLDSRDVKFGIALLTESGAVGERQAKAVKDFIRDYRSTGESLVAG